MAEVRQGPDLYEYVGNDPLDQTDPLGLTFIKCAKAVADLVAATTQLGLDYGGAMAHGGCTDPGHRKEMEQRSQRLQQAYDRVKKDCSDWPGAAEALAGASLLMQQVAELLDEAFQTCPCPI